MMLIVSVGCNTLLGLLSNQISTFSELNSISSLVDSVFISPYKKFFKTSRKFVTMTKNEDFLKLSQEKVSYQ